MNRRTLLLAAAFGLAAWGVNAQDALAQSAAEKPMEHSGMTDHQGHHAGPSPDGAFHRRFNDAEKWAKEFDNPERDAWQEPEKVLDVLHIDHAAKVADIGAGTGYFSVRIAKRAPDGAVYAADVEPDMVAYLGERAKHDRLKNLVAVQSSAENANLPEPVDLILVVDTYHHIGYRTQYFSKLKSSLTTKGRLVIIDFKADSPNGPPPEHRVPPKTVEEELGAAGYSLGETHDFLPRQYFLVFQKRD
jgi:SAM-dependent methyltransferase